MTQVHVDGTPRTELTAMTDSMGKLIQDIDKLDGYRRTMMEELKHLRVITLYYNRLYPELHGRTSTGQHKRDTRADNEEPKNVDDAQKDSKKNI